jgi:hypothetical protein
MKMVKSILTVLMVWLLLGSSLGIFVTTSILSQLLAKSHHHEFLGLTVLLMGMVSVFSCLFTIKTIVIPAIRVKS